MKKKRAIKSLSCLLLCGVLLLPLLRNVLASNEREEREQKIYKFLRDEMGFGNNAEAIACGILGNIFAETGGAPYNYDPATTGDGGTSGGICGWHDGGNANNWTRLKNYCAEHNCVWDSLEGQLDFLKYDLYESGKYNDTRTRLMAVPNTPEGAYYAAYIFCFWYEGPADRVTSGNRRGGYAQEFWEKYTDNTVKKITTGDPTKSELSIATTYPEEKIYGDYFSSFSLKGSISSNYPITNVQVCVRNAAGNIVSGYHKNGSYITLNMETQWDYKLFDLYWDGPDTFIGFSAIDNPGSYIYCVEATDISGKTASEHHIFHVISKTPCYVTYDTAGAGVISGKGVNFGDTVKLPAAPTKTGYTFAGWSDGTNVYPAGDSYRVMNTKVTMTALWTACEHEYSDTWQYDKNGHWQVCTVCGVSSTPQNHSFTDTVIPAAPTAKGYTLHACTVCGYSYTDSETEYDSGIGIPVEPYSAGDLSGDGYLNGDDIAALGSYLTAGTAITDEAAAAADVNGDGTVSSPDLVALAQRLLRGTEHTE